MKKTTKVLIGSIAIAVIIFIIAAMTTPKSTSLPTTLNSEASLTLISPFGGSVELGQRQDVRWASFNYAPETVSINIIRKVGDNPARYELVRTVATATINDGNGVWIPALTDLGGGIYVEVACATSPQGCRASESSESLAVVDNGRFSNTAAAYQAIESEENN